MVTSLNQFPWVILGPAIGSCIFTVRDQHCLRSAVEICSDGACCIFTVRDQHCLRSAAEICSDGACCIFTVRDQHCLRSGAAHRSHRASMRTFGNVRNLRKTSPKMRVIACHLRVIGVGNGSPNEGRFLKVPPLVGR